MENLHDDGADMAEIEARLYAQVHHDSSASVSEQVPQYTPAPVRLVSDRSVVNSSTNVANRQTTNRYWLSSGSTHQAPSGPRAKSTPYRPNLNPTPNSKSGQSKFAPYQSILSGIRSTSQQLPEKSPPIRDKSAKKSTKKQPKQKFLNPMNVKNLSKIEKLNKVHKKKERVHSAKSTHQRQQTQPLMETICLDDSSDDNEQPIRLDNDEVKFEPPESDGDDDVIEIPVPPPPLVTIDDSSEESNIMQSPQKNKKKANKKKLKKASGRTEHSLRPSSRCVSPSNSSIMSDDFIGGNDRDLLRGIDSGSQDANDIELQHDMTVEHLLRLRKMGKSPGIAKVLEVTNTRRSKNLSSDGTFLHPTDKTRPGTSTSMTNIETNPPSSPPATQTSESDTESSTDLTKNSNAIKNILASDFIPIGDDDDASPSRLASKKKRKNSRGAHSDADDSIYTGKVGLAGRMKAASEPETTLDSTDSEPEFTMDVYDEGEFNRVPKLVRSEDEKRYLAAKRQKPNPFDQTYYEQDSFVTMLSNICHENFEEGGPNDDNGEMAAQNRNDNDTAILEEIEEIFDSKSDDENEGTTIDVSDEESLSLMMDGNEPNSETILNTKYINPVAYQHEYFRGKKVKPRKMTGTDEIDVGLRPDTETGPEKGVVQREIGWNEEMRRFYYESWGGEKFDIRQILRSQASHGNAWHIVNRDKFPYTPHNRNIRCRNCQELGHIQSKCLAPVKKCVCHMCGQEGHREPRCPNKICLRCGSPARVYGYGCVRCRNEDSMICALCRIKGHSVNYCPDKWRRYYATTIDNNIVVNNVVYNSRNAMYCSVCASRGHHSNDCHNSSKIWLQKLYRTQIQSHTPTYPKKFADDQDTLDRKASKMAYALFTGHEGDFSFNFDANVTSEPNFTYNRFKRAVGLADAVPAETPAKRRKRRRKERPKIDLGEAKELVRSILSDYSFSEEMRKLDDEQQTSGDKFELSFITDGVEMDRVDDDRKDEIIQSEPPVFADAKREVSPPRVTDEDSSYNFSEYFPKKGQTDVETTTENQSKETTPPPSPATTEVPTKVTVTSPAPDFIPLSATNEPTDDIQLTNVVVSTEAKIFLSKLHCKILMGLEGTNFLNAASSKHELFFRFVWQAFGNILLITGTRDRQDQFHTELIDYLKQKEDETYTKQIENSTRVPKHRLKLIRFLEDNIKGLDRDHGNMVKSCYNKLKYFEENNNRANSDRMRRQLNVILLGQMGFKEGRAHLTALKTNLATLQREKIINTVSESFRNEIQQHYNYIFSSFNHQNYEDLVEQYQRVRYNQPSAVASSTTKANDIAAQSTDDNDGADKNEAPEAPPQPAETHVDEPPSDEQAVGVSAFWSEKCTKIVEECREILGQLKNNKGMAKLEMVSQKAQNHQLTYNDYSSLLKILTKIKKNNE